MKPPCTMPGCVTEANQTNRIGQPTCLLHKTVAVSGSWMGEGMHHHEPEGDDQ